MVERQSNTIILYPVENRSNGTLIPLFERHVEKGSTICIATVGQLTVLSN
jgi:hypothetical protein